MLETAAVQRPPLTASGWYAGIFSGSGTARDTTVDASYQCFFCAPVSVSKPVSFDEGDTQAIRVGAWGGEGWSHAGFAAEFGRAKAQGREAEFNYSYFSFIPMLRLPLFANAALPEGRVNIYGGLAISFVIDGDGSVVDAAFPRTVSGTLDGSGQALLVGAGLNVGRLTLALEQRDTRMRLAFSDIGDSGSARLSAKVTLLGLACRF